ncbi:DUF1302 family protein [Magnetospirillum sp. 15-1]|uniref:DUF1302 family protein n=1 Tax=Magnetospirillum sp. 15-1 TaxID=1979370 RepID=UPI000BBC7A4B|nr:DUF1302 family protein [Magnetospirillum sp. 15-1]
MRRRLTITAMALIWPLVLALPAKADESDGWVVKNKVDEEVRFRPTTGLSKARSMGQSDLDKKLNVGGPFSMMKIHATLRASYDGVYDLNPSEYGSRAGSSVSFANNDGSKATSWGGGNTLPIADMVLGAGNPNEGMAIVNGWRRPDNGLIFATPVRPCDVDSRGCIKDYMDYSKNDLAAPELNSRADVVRELFVDAEVPVGSNTLALRVGRQQLVWGRTDLFRVLDVVNPVDYSRNNIYDELQDIRIPMGMVRADYRMGARGPFDDLNVQGLWMFEKFRPNNLGQAGSPNNPAGAAGMFRALKNCWDNGCTVGNYNGGNNALNFGRHQIGIREANMPEWNLSNMTYGGKVEGEVKGIGFSVNALTMRSQMPSLRGGIVSRNGLNGNYGVWDYAPAFDIEFPRLNIFGGSLDFTVDPIDTAFRFESVYTQGEEFADTAQKQLYKKSDVVRYVIGADRNTFIPFLNERRAFLISGQVFGQHILQHELHKTRFNGTVGMPDWDMNWIGTLMVKGWYMADTVSPQMVFARDFRAGANVLEPSVEWIPAAAWRFRLGANVKFGEYRNTFGNNADAATGVPWDGQASKGAWLGTEPFGNLRTGIIGMAHDETEIFANATFRF